jgi:DNA-binding IclR family transcriptional regulator
MKTNPGKQTSIIAKCYALLNHLADAEWHTIRQIAKALGMDKDTVHRHVAWMEHHGLAEIRETRAGGVRMLRCVFEVNGVKLTTRQLSRIVAQLMLAEQDPEMQEIVKIFAAMLSLQKGGSHHERKRRRTNDKNHNVDHQG